MRDNIGNILEVVHNTGCTLEIAKEALANCNNWQDTFKYAKERVEE